MAAVWVGLATAAIAASKAPPSMAVPVASDPFGWFDNSGWTVATGGSTASASRTQAGEGSEITRMVPWLAVALVGVMAAKAWGKKS
ncbi:MAG TPA: hypothetical protein VJ673_02725 [Aromatoleum sp.]|uniref:hypothetical protein n=1 Tax=Aromatoleum sp. TaxID=2307007 RepID=UPI002B46B566|nr:hypothetical protein [Aromatoleum sp.]HJV24567.1 hypothetical protein [Aromatoleum sp.]